MLSNWFKPKNEAKKEVTIIDRMRQALVDEKANWRRITQWRVSKDTIAAIYKSESTYTVYPDENPLASITRLYGIPCTIVDEWHGETFEYEAIDIPKPVPPPSEPGYTIVWK